MGTEIEARETGFDFSADGLIGYVKEKFGRVIDNRNLPDVEIPLEDALQAAYAMFALKSPSLLEFDKEINANSNLRSIFKLKRIPSDTQMRVILDDVAPNEIRPLFKGLFAKLQRAELLEKFRVLGEYYAISGDGTSYYSSNKIHCPSCLEKKSGDEIIYHHQMYAATLMHPDRKEVIPLMPEPIIKQDGKTKNDCESNAAKRFWNDFRREHPHLKTIAVEDSLFSNAPHILELQKLKIHFIIGAKKSDHAYLFQKAQEARERNESIEYRLELNGKIHTFSAVNGLALNGSNKDLKVNFIEYWQLNPKTNETLHFSWVTDIILTTENLYEIMRIGRARWKIENETFNTLKNQGYHFEHNFGHGNKNLSVVACGVLRLSSGTKPVESIASIAMLVFLTDQIQQLAYQLFKDVLVKTIRKKYFWPKLKFTFECIELVSMKQLYEFLVSGKKLDPFLNNSS